MNAFRNFIQEQIKVQGINARTMAERMGLAETTLSLILSGKRTSVNLKTFCKMTKGISPKKSVQIEFFLATMNSLTKET